MSKYLAAVAITLVTGLSAPVMADWTGGEIKYFVGGELGKTWLQASSGDLSDVFDLLGMDNKYKYKNPMQYGIRVGAYVDENVRVYVNLNQLSGSESKEFSGSVTDGGKLITGSINADSKITNRQLTVSADYLFDLNEFDIPVKPFFGGTLGANWAELKNDLKVKVLGLDKPIDGQVDETKSKVAFAYGIQAGILGQVGDFDLELGYRYLMHKNKFEFEEFGEWKMDKSQTAYFAVSYRF